MKKSGGKKINYNEKELKWLTNELGDRLEDIYEYDYFDVSDNIKSINDVLELANKLKRKLEDVNEIDSQIKELLSIAEAIDDKIDYKKDATKTNYDSNKPPSPINYKTAYDLQKLLLERDRTMTIDYRLKFVIIYLREIIQDATQYSKNELTKGSSVYKLRTNTKSISSLALSLITILETSLLKEEFENKNKDNYDEDDDDI